MTLALRSVRPMVTRVPFAVFRADAAPDLGGGHVQRCLALAQALGDAGWRLAFAFRAPSLAIVPELATAAHELLALHGRVEDEPAELAALLPSGCDLLIVDHYARDQVFERACRDFAACIMALDDQPGRPHDCDLLLDATPGREPSAYRPFVPVRCQLLLGPDHALLRKQFAAARPGALARREPRETPRHLLVSIGMTDPGNLTSIVLDGVALSGLPLSVDVVLGCAAAHLARVRERIEALGRDARLHVDVADMASLMAAADLAIGASGSSSFERCCLGLPSLIVIAADNQRQFAEALVKAGAVESLGDGKTLTPERVAEALQVLMADAGRRQLLSRNAAALCDGAGTLRVMVALISPVAARDGKEVTARLAQASDRDLIFAWQRHPGTRCFAHNPQAPSAEEHDRWFQQAIADPARVLLMVLHGGEPEGLLRLDRIATHTQRVSILTAPGCYRLGIGVATLALARRLYPGAELQANVLPGNVASHALFRRAGYHESKPGLYVHRVEAAMAS
jgi:UDP-2,4-diacetamido-2,4,6-trideoxy-beta-L-altropyranose hydrolase